MSVDLEILDSRNRLDNNLLVVINGTNNHVKFQTSKGSFVSETFNIELSSNNGYAFYQRSKLNTIDIHLENKTAVKVILLPGMMNQKILSVSEIIDKIK